MPFADEPSVVHVVSYRPSWADEYELLASRLRSALGPVAIGVDHVGSTAVPGMLAKDVIDVQVRVARLDEGAIEESLRGSRFRRRPEPWNNREVSFGTACSKMVFAPPVGERACNVHIRIDGAPNAQMALLVRDFLRADADVRRAWAQFKVLVAEQVGDLDLYGQIKAPATVVLARAASAWAERAEAGSRS